MASNHTANFGLNQWAATDPVLREDFNADNQKIEEAMGGFGNCRIVTGSYVGTGVSGASHPNILVFDFEPKYLMVRAESYGNGSYGFDNWFSWCGGAENASPGMTANRTISNVFTANGNIISWYCGSNDTYSTTCQLNLSGKNYYYMALG